MLGFALLGLCGDLAYERPSGGSHREWNWWAVAAFVLLFAGIGTFALTNIWAPLLIGTGSALLLAIIASMHKQAGSVKPLDNADPGSMDVASTRTIGSGLVRTVLITSGILVLAASALVVLLLLSHGWTHS